MSTSPAPTDLSGSIISGSLPQDAIASDEMSQFDRPLSVSSMQKLQKWPMLQSLGFNGMKKDLTTEYHSIKDWFRQMDMYSQTNGILKTAWMVIKQIAGNNPQQFLTVVPVPGLGQVGTLFQGIPGFGEVFADNSDQLGTAQTIAPTAISGEIPEL